MKQIIMPQTGEQWRELRESKGLNWAMLKVDLGSAYMSYQWRLEKGEGVGYWKALRLAIYLNNHE